MISLINYIRDLAVSENVPGILLDVLEEFEVFCYLRFVRALIKNLLDVEKVTKEGILKALKELERDLLDTLSNIASKSTPLIYLEKIGFKEKIELFKEAT